MAEEALLDTIVILRHALGDDRSQGQQAGQLFEQARQGRIRLIVPSLVMAQVVWTLEFFYQASREYIAGLLQALFVTPGVVAIESRVASRRIQIYRGRNIEIVDAYLVALAGEMKTTVLATFNKKDFLRFPHLKLIP